MVSEATRTELRETAAELEEETVEFLQELVRTNSVNPPGDYSDLHDLLMDTYDDLEWETETIWAPDELLEEHGFEHPRPNVLSYPVRGDGPSIALIAHLDTVPVDEEAWTRDPFAGEIEDGRLYGRGAKDCKGRVACYTLAARILEENNLLPEDATVIVAGTADEEIGSAAGAEFLCDSGQLAPDYAILEGNINTIWNAGSGVLRYDVTVSGKASHAGMYPKEGANAILSTARVLTAIEEYAEEVFSRTSEVPGIDGPTCVPATIEGGVKTNVVPSSCTFSVDMRNPPDYDIDEFAEEFESVVHGVDLIEGTSVETKRFRYDPPYHFDSEGVLPQSVKENAEAILGMDVPISGISATTDARHFTGTDTTCINYGPGDSDSNIHGADENILVEQVLDAGAILAGSILDVVDHESPS